MVPTSQPCVEMNGGGGAGAVLACVVVERESLRSELLPVLGGSAVGLCLGLSSGLVGALRCGVCCLAWWAAALACWDEGTATLAGMAGACPDDRHQAWLVVSWT